MSGKTIIVIGALSMDSIHFMWKAPEPGEIIVAKDQHKEFGGRGANIAISVYRASRTKPKNGSNVNEGDDGVDVRLIAGVPDEYHLSRFGKKLLSNGIRTDWLKILDRVEGEGDLEPDNCTSIMEGENGRARQVCGFDTSNQWTVDYFNDIDKMCGDVVPDLVIVTMELKKNIIEQIIDTVHAAGIDVLLYASPGETLGLEHYGKLKHLVCNESDAGRMLGYKSEEVNKDKWPEICESFTRRGVENVVLKAGLDGAYYRNIAGQEGFASGYKTDRDNIDQTGSTTAFIGPYATNYVSNKESWDLQVATEAGNKSGALFAIDIGYESAIPWRSEIDADFEVLYQSIEDIGAEPAAPVRKGRRLRANRKKD